MNTTDKYSYQNGSLGTSPTTHERLGSLEALRAVQSMISERRDPLMTTIVIPAGTCGQASGANDLIRVTKREILAKRLAGKLHLRVTGCHGFCQMEPSLLVDPFGVLSKNVPLAALIVNYRNILYAGAPPNLGVLAAIGEFLIRTYNAVQRYPAYIIRTIQSR